MYTGSWLSDKEVFLLMGSSKFNRAICIDLIYKKWYNLEEYHVKKETRGLIF